MASANTPSTFARHLSPLAGSLWIFFLILSALMAPVWAFDIGEAQIRSAIAVPELREALLWLSGIIDVVWMAVAAVVVYSSLVRKAGLSAARRMGALVLGCSWLVGALSVWSGWPLGQIHFTSRFGALFGAVSLGWLLLWCVVIFGARDAALALLPRASHPQTALLAALLAGLTDLNLEPLASKTRAWWLWMERTPHPFAALQSSLVWCLAGLALAWCFRAPILAKAGSARWPRSVQVFVLFNALLVLAHIGSALRK